MAALIDPPVCDYLLFFATSSEEAALKRAIGKGDLKWERSSGRFGDFFDLGRLGTSRVVAVQTEVGALGPSGSIGSAHFYLEKTRATGIICLGMAFGLSRDLQKAGTVLVSESLFPYDDRIVRPDASGSFKCAYDRGKKALPCKEDLLRIFRDHEANRNEADDGFKVQFGTLLAGSAKIECTAYRDKLVAWCQEIVPVIGGDMEGIALLSLRERGAGIVVKGICDFAEDDQTDEVKRHRSAACKNAAKFVVDALRRWNPAASEV